MTSDYIAQAMSAADEIRKINRDYMSNPSYSGYGMKHRTECFIALIRQAMYPNVFATKQPCDTAELGDLFGSAATLLHELCLTILGNEKTAAGLDADGVTAGFFAELPRVVHLLKLDIAAAYEGDPAASSEEEIMYAYPSFEAISIFRMAHLLYLMKLPMLPRIMTEYAHKQTGIDIHPGATIGQHFFIDHGTGVVIGETCVIGDHVKLYQGVTLGARSFELDENGNPVKGIKRHPNIGNHVVIYAGATILGGDTYVGDGAVIGGNVWLTRSVGAGETVTNSGTYKKPRQ